MTAERYRMPIGRATRALAYDCEPAMAYDLFQAVAAEPHPDFLARAAIWRDQAAGVISLAEARRRSENVGRAIAAKASRKTGPATPRHQRTAPGDSRQYAGDMATTAARDDRLVPQAKALLQVLRARCGKGCETATTKTTLADIMARSTRTIARHLRDLEKFGYIVTRIRTTGRGLHLGLTITITERVLPFYEDADALASWLAAKPEALDRPFAGCALSGNQGVTRLSSKNQAPNISIIQRLSNSFRKSGEAFPVPS